MLFSLIPLTAVAAKDQFELVRKGNTVCSSDAPPICYPVVGQFPDPFEVTRNVASPASTLDKPLAKELLDNYRRVSIRNFAVRDEGQLSDDKNYYEYSFFASVYWQGRAYMEGTLYTEGLVRIRANAPFSEVPEGKAQTFQIVFTKYSDSATEAQKGWLRITETSARNVHFMAIYGPKVDANKETMRLLNDMIAPVMVSEVFFKPIRR